MLQKFSYKLRGHMNNIWTNNSIPCSITARIPSSEQIIAGKTRADEALARFEERVKVSYWTSHTSLADSEWVGASSVPTPERTIGCWGHRRSHANTVPEEPPVFKHHHNFDKDSTCTLYNRKTTNWKWNFKSLQYVV